MDTATMTYTCKTPVASGKVCGKTGLAADMWNIGKRHTGGKLVVVCGKHAHEARKNDLRVFRLAGTLELEAKREIEEEAERQASSPFFQAFKKFRDNEEDASGRRNNNRH